MRFSSAAIVLVCSAIAGYVLVSAAEDETSVAGAKRDDKSFFFQYSTSTITVLATSTKAVLTTCYSTEPGLPACNGRKRRSMWKLNDPDEEKSDDGDEELDSSLSSSQSAPSNRKGKALTIWKFAYSTLTVTTKSFIPGTTATFTAQCTIPGVFTTPSCGFLHFD